MLQSTIDRINAYQAWRLGCAVDDLHEQRVTFVTHGQALDGYRGVYVLRASQGGRGAVVSAPPERVTLLQAAVAHAMPEEIFDAAFLTAALAPDVASVVGPASIAYADPSTFAAAPLASVRRLDIDDRGTLSELKDACDATEWRHGNVQPDHDPIFACFEGGHVVAAASWESHGPSRHIGVITHPAHRGRGRAKAVGSAITAAALAEDAIPQWQALRSNAPSIAVGRRLGFEELYQSIAFRLE